MYPRSCASLTSGATRRASASLALHLSAASLRVEWLARGDYFQGLPHLRLLIKEAAPQLAHKGDGGPAAGAVAQWPLR
jgi:hypothetical protein